MFKFKDEAYLKPSSVKNKSCIVGIRNRFLFSFLLSSLISEMKQTVPFFLGILNVGTAHSELFLHFKTSMFTNLLNFVIRVSSCTFGMGNGLTWYGWDSSRSSILKLYSVLL